MSRAAEGGLSSWVWFTPPCPWLLCLTWGGREGGSQAPLLGQGELWKYLSPGHEEEARSPLGISVIHCRHADPQGPPLPLQHELVISRSQPQPVPGCVMVGRLPRRRWQPQVALPWDALKVTGGTGCWGTGPSEPGWGWPVGQEARAFSFSQGPPSLRCVSVGTAQHLCPFPSLQNEALPGQRARWAPKPPSPQRCNGPSNTLPVTSQGQGDQWT